MGHPKPPGSPRSKPTPRDDRTDELDIEIMKLLEAEPGLTDIAIGDRLNMECETVSRRRGRPCFRRLYEQRNLPARDVIAAHKRKAAKVYAGLLDAHDAPHVQEKAAARILGLDLEPEAGTSGGGLPLPPDLVDAIRRYYAAPGSRTVPVRRRRRAA